MKNRVRKMKYICMTLLCVGVTFGCAPGQDTSVSKEVMGDTAGEPETAQPSIQEQESENEHSGRGESEIADAYFFERQLQENVEQFYDEAEEQDIEWKEAAKYLQILTEDNIFQDGTMALTGLRIADIDGNGQMDMMVMVLDAKEEPFYGAGALWFYMNDDEPCCFSEEDCSYYGWFDVFWDDIDNDDNVEIVFSAQGTGCGAVGDSYKAVFKYRCQPAAGIEQMQLPSDFEIDYDFGLGVEVYQESETDRYTAYCPYFDEKISFCSQNIADWSLPQTAQLVGGEVRGFYNLQVAEYEGRKVLQASEYLNGEGGIVHNVATAQFLITWKEDGTPEVIKWWIEADGNTYANSHGSRISYSDGYIYYASQSDHDYLYRARVDGSEPQCLAKVRAADICVRDDDIYFVNQSDGNGIYRIRTDGSGMMKLSASGRDVQVTAEYVYFCDTYEAEYDLSGLATDELSESGDCYLYRMKGDGSGRELIAADVQQYVLSDGYYQEVYHIGSVYYTKYKYIGDGDEVELSLHRVGIDGQKEEQFMSFRGKVDKDQKEKTELVSTKLMVYGGKVYCVWSRWGGSKAIIFQYDPWSGTNDTISVPIYTDSCIYKGYFYGLCEQEADGQQRQVEIFRVALNGGDSETISAYTVQGTGSDESISDIFATGKGVFFRRFVSKQEGWKWFRITEDKEVQEWEEGGNAPSPSSAKETGYTA